MDHPHLNVKEKKRKYKHKWVLKKCGLLKLDSLVHIERMIMIVQVANLKSKIEEAKDEYKRLLAEAKALDVKEE